MERNYVTVAPCIKIRQNVSSAECILNVPVEREKTRWQTDSIKGSDDSVGLEVTSIDQWKQVSAVAEGPARRGACRVSCCINRGDRDQCDKLAVDRRKYRDGRTDGQDRIYCFRRSGNK